MALDIVLTREDANSESALLVEWLVGDRERVRKGQAVCVVETSKSAIEIEAPGDGTLCQLFAAEQEIELGTRIAVIATSPDELAAVDSTRPCAAPESASARASNVTRKAAALAAERGLDIRSIVKSGFITVEDVEAALAERAGFPATAEPAWHPLSQVSLDGVTLPQVLEAEEHVGVLDQDFLDALRADPSTFRKLSSEEKCAAYREHGALLGEGVVLGERSVVVAPRVVIGDGVELGSDSVVQCDEVFSVGALTRFCSQFELRCRRAFIGAGGYISDRVRIGGGGIHDPQALLVLGDLTFLGDEVFINPCRPVVVGREVFVTMRSVIVTHNVGHSVLEGFENRFAPVVLEDRAQVGIGAVIYAGCRVGRESIVLSNSYVVTDIPAGKLAAGVPARPIGTASRRPASARRVEIARRILADLREQLEAGGRTVGAVDVGSADGFTIDFEGQTSQVLFVERLTRRGELPEVDGETVVLTFDLAGGAREGCSVLDLLGKRVYGSGGLVLDSVREFCRKRGVRFDPGPWRYRGGLL